MGSKFELKVGASEKWWHAKTIAIVTGANKGIGKEAAQMLAENGLTTIVAARDEKRGQQAVQDIKNATGAENVFFEQLDLCSAKSIEQFAQTVKQKYKEVSILINNAGMAYKGNAFGADEAKVTMDTNFRGTRHVCEALLPHMAKPSRIINVSSGAGYQNQLKSQSLLRRFQEVEDADTIDQLAEEFVAGIKDNSYKEKGWSSSMYGISKLCETTYTRVLAEQLQSKQIDVNACCPGHCSTDMSSHSGSRSAAQGADTPVWLALLAAPGTHAKLFRDRKEIAP